MQRGYRIVSHRPMCFWSVMDAEDWLKKRKPTLAFKYCDIFVRNYVTGRVLVDITEQQLINIGVVDFEDRQELLLAIRREKLQNDLNELTNLSKT